MVGIPIISLQNIFPAVLLLILFIFLIIWLFVFSGVYREFERDQIYIDERGLINFRKHFTDKFGHPYAQFVVLEIKRLIVQKSRIVFHGTIMVYVNGRSQKTWRLGIPRELENAEDLIIYAQHNYQKEKSHQWSDKLVPLGEVSYREIGGAIARPLGRVLGLALKIILSLAVVGLTCAYYVEIKQMEHLLLMAGMIFGGLFGAMALVYFGGYITWEYLIDLFSKRVKKYQGYYNKNQKLNNRHNANIYPVKHYNGYYQILFSDTKEDRDYHPMSAGDIKSDPVDGRRLLVKDLTIFKTVNKKRKMEIYYLPKSKVVVKVRQIEEPEEET